MTEVDKSRDTNVRSRRRHIKSGNAQDTCPALSIRHTPQEADKIGQKQLRRGNPVLRLVSCTTTWLRQRTVHVIRGTAVTRLPGQSKRTRRTWSAVMTVDWKVREIFLKKFKRWKYRRHKWSMKTHENKTFFVGYVHFTSRSRLHSSWLWTMFGSSHVGSKAYSV